LPASLVVGGSDGAGAGVDVALSTTLLLRCMLE
jgi:hypothetical protein